MPSRPASKPIGSDEAVASQVPLSAVVVAMKLSMLGKKLLVLASIVEASCMANVLLSMLAGGNYAFQA